jgi:hypothetical protein
MRIPAVLVLADDWNRLLARWGLSPAEAARVRAAEAARLESQQLEQMLAAVAGAEL